MDYQTVSTELADRLRTISGINVLKFDARRVSPPCASIGLPVQVDYDVTLGRGFDAITMEIFIFIGNANQEAAHNEVANYIGGGTGPKAIKYVLESGDYTSFDAVQVKTAKPYEVTVGEANYIGINFEVVVTGRGQ